MYSYSVSRRKISGKGVDFPVAGSVQTIFAPPSA